ncbi:cation acetate symporter [Nonomuraea sp. NPDC049480]|uniref:cation acetate symporter n=1 Tax=Nonomuraea sp. NPDC049480 TaxID=3364353 RepID=UPI0037932995
MTNGFAAPAIGVVISVALTLLLLGVMIAARRSQHSPADFYVAGRRIGAGQNALALFASFILLSTMVTMTGHIALNGFDAFLFAAGFTLSWLIALLIFASPLRNVGGQTIGDVFALRTGERSARTASLVVTLLLYATYTIVMMNAVGIVASVMFGVAPGTGQAVVVAAVGLLVTLFVLVGGMLGTTRLLAVKAVLVIGILAALTIVVLAKYRWNLGQLLGDAQAKALPHPGGYDLLGTGREFGEGSPIVHLSKLFAVIVGHAALPYLFMRHFTVTSGRDARRSTGWASMMFVPFYLCTAVLGLGAVALLGGQNIGMTPPTRDITLPRLADLLGGPWVAGLLGATAMLVVAGILAALLISAVTSVTRDFRAARRMPLDSAAELRAARRNTVIIGVAAVVVSVALLQVNTHSLIPITVDLGGVVLPAVIYSLFWKRFNTAGLRWTVYGGIAVTGILFLFSGLMSGTPVAMLSGVDFHVIDFDPALVAVPLTFLLGYLGTISSRERDSRGFAELQVRAFTGADVPARRDRTAGPAHADERPDERADEPARASQTPSRAR